jgi:hypothetical protein
MEAIETKVHLASNRQIVLSELKYIHANLFQTPTAFFDKNVYECP